MAITVSGISVASGHCGSYSHFDLGLVGNQAFSKFPHRLLRKKLGSHNDGTLESIFVRGKALESGGLL